jgi:hypothetical protein
MSLNAFSILFLALTALSGCASSTPQTDNFFDSTSNLPPKKEIPRVPFIKQEAAQCGPATLAMAMRWNGHLVSAEELTREIFIPGLNGTVQTDMLRATRKYGFLAIPLNGLKPLLTEISNNTPVIVFENLAFTWSPAWHYALVYGYDLQNKTVLMHSGPQEGKVWDMTKFERSWKLADYWGLVVLPPGKLAASATELEHASAAVGLETAGHPDAAAKTYRAMLARWPNSLTALIGLGNYFYNKKHFRNSVRYLSLAVKTHPQSASARHNLEVARTALK